MIQQLIVGLIVVCAAIAVLRRYAPKPVKRAMRSGSARLARAVGWHKAAERIARQAEAGTSCGDGCGTCGNCGTAPITPQETSIPVDSLRRSRRR